MLISETWILSDDIGRFNLYEIEGYSFYHASRKSGGKNIVGGGVAAYILNDLTHSCIDSHVGLFEKLKIKIRVNTEWIKIICYYRPPNSISMNSFMSDLEAELNDESIEKKIITGDININTREDSNISRDYRLLIDSNNAKIINGHITRPKSNSTLDHQIIQSIDYNHMICTIEVPGLSDHNALLSAFDVSLTNTPKNKLIQKKFVDHKKLFESFKLNNKKFNSPSNFNPDRKLELINQAINNSMSKSCTVRNYKIKNASPLSSWWSVKVLELLKEKDDLSMKIRKRKNKMLPCDELKLRISILDKNLRDAMSNSYQEHFNNILKDGDAKKIWSEINKTIGTKKAVKKITLEKNNEIITDSIDVGNSLNDFFINIGEKIIPSANISVENLNKFNTLPNVQNSLFLEPTNAFEVFSIIRDLDKNKAIGADNISVSIIKTLNPRLCVYVAELINCMFETGIYPKELKEGLVTAIPKCTNATVEDEFRPITVLKCINKPVEKIINIRLEKYFEDLGVLDKNQFGFVKNSSTEPAVLELYHHALSSLEKDENLGVVFLDIRKAFDSMPHDTVLAKMECYGVRGIPLNLFQSFFSDRTQAVKIGSVLSEFMEVIRGIAQGSIIAPSIFNLNLNDFKDLNLKAVASQRYADDTILIYKFQNEQDFIENVKVDLLKTIEYFRINGMALNVNKSNFIIFHKKKSLHLPNKIKLDDQNAIHRVTNCRYLGIEFDENLTFKTHIEKLISKLSAAVNIIRKLKWHLPTSILKSIYYAYFHSHLCYIPFIWGFCAESLIKPIQVLQNRALKHVFHLPILYHTVDLYSGPAKGILPIKGLITQMTLCFIKKVIANLTRSNIKFDIITGKTRQNGQISRIGKPPSTSYGKRDIMNVAPIIFNKLPKELIQSRFGSFKIKLKQILETIPEQLLNLSQFSLFTIQFPQIPKK